MEPAVLRLLALRPRSIHEVRQYLIRKKASTDLIDQIISGLIKQGLLDDQEFARWLIASRSKTRGPARIIAELRHFGISPDIYQPLLPNSQASLDAAQTLISRQSRYRDLSDPAVRKRAYDYLQRHGFSASIARTAIDWDQETE